jgi:ribonuclease D
MAREAEAERLDVPAAELVRNDVLLAIGRARPRSKAGLAKVAWPIASVHDDGVAEALLQAVGQGLADGPLSPEDAAWFEPARLPRGEANTRKGREIRVSAWRRGEAEARKVHEQVVLPGHCASDLVAASVSNLDDLAGIRGLGPFRIARYGAALLEALRGSEP